jgi:hypothetical protein
MSRGRPDEAELLPNEAFSSFYGSLKFTVT